MGNAVEYSYDIGNDNRRSQANLTEVKQTPDSRGGEEQKTIYIYETDTNMVKTITDPKGNATQFSIAKLTGNMEQATYPGGKIYHYAYNTYGQVETVTDPMSKVTRYSYYPENAPSGSGEAAVSSRELDSSTGGFLQGIVVDEGGDNISRQFVYNKFAGIAASTDGEGGLTVYEYYDNPFNEVERIIQGAASTSDGQPAVNLLTQFTAYDDNGNVQSSVQNGITTTYSYDKLNRVISLKNQAGTLTQETSYEYDGVGNIEKITYPNGIADEFDYDSRNLLWQKHEGNRTTKNSFYYNNNGKLSLMEDGENNLYSYFYDGHDRLKTTNDPLGNLVNYDYDVNSNVTSVQSLGVNGNTIKINYEYDTLNRLTNQKLEKSDQSFLTTAYSYNEASQVNAITNPNNQTYNITRTGSGLPDVVSDPMGNADDQDYDRRGWVKKVTETEAGGRSLQTSMTHNVLGNLSQHDDSINREYNHFYNPKQLLDSSQDPEGGVVSYQYDAFGRVERSIRHINYNSESMMFATTYDYDLNNNLKSVTDPEGNVTSYFYDQKDRLTEIKYPDGKTESVTYNNNDQIHTYTDLNGTYISNSYDAAGRLTNRNIVPAAGVAGSIYESFNYDGLGRLISASNNDADVEFAYDGAGRQTGETVSWKDGSGLEMTITATYGVARDFDNNGNKISLTYPSGKLLILTPDPLDRLSSVTSAGKNLVSYSYEGKAKITGKNLQNAVNMTSTFDDGRRPTTLNYTGGSDQPVFAKTMDWNRVDLKQSDKETGQGEEYTYDTGYRLRKVVDTKKNTQSEYQIDGVENIDSKK
ncbi:hypothetical protein ACFLRB_04840, partial [Acidobacteriota bacterium]